MYCMETTRKYIYIKYYFHLLTSIFFPVINFLFVHFQTIARLKKAMSIR